MVQQVIRLSNIDSVVVQKAIDAAIDKLNLTPSGIGAATPEDVRQAIDNLTATDIDGAVTQAELENVRQAITNLKAADIDGAAALGDIQAIQLELATLARSRVGKSNIPFNVNSWTTLFNLNSVAFGRSGGTTIVLTAIDYGRRTNTNSYVHLVRHTANGAYVAPVQIGASAPNGQFGVLFSSENGYLRVKSYAPPGSGANGTAGFFSNIGSL